MLQHHVPYLKRQLKLFFPSIFEHTHLSDVEQVSVYETLHEIGILFRMPVPCEGFLCKCETCQRSQVIICEEA